MSDSIPGPHADMATDHRARMNLAPLSNDSSFFDDDSRPDLHPLAYLNFGINKCSGMNRRHDSWRFFGVGSWEIIIKDRLPES